MTSSASWGSWLLPSKPAHDLDNIIEQLSSRFVPLERVQSLEDEMQRLRTENLRLSEAVAKLGGDDGHLAAPATARVDQEPSPAERTAWVSALARKFSVSTRELEGRAELDLAGQSDGLTTVELHRLAWLLRDGVIRATRLSLDGSVEMGIGWLPIDELRGSVPADAIDLSERLLGLKSAVVIARCMGASATLRGLDLSRNGLGDGGAEYIAKALATNSTLTSLRIGSNNLCDDAAAAIAEALEGNATLTALDMSDNERDGLGDGRAIALAAVLPGTALTDLDLGKSALGDDAAAVLAGALRHTKVARLALDRNKLGAKGCAALAAVLTDTTLEELNLGNNRTIGPKGCAALAGALRFAPLTSLDISWCRVGVEGATALATAMKEGSRLRHVNLQRNNVPAGWLKTNQAMLQAVESGVDIKL